MRFRLVQKSVALYDFELCNDCRPALSLWLLSFLYFDRTVVYFILASQSRVKMRVGLNNYM